MDKQNLRLEILSQVESGELLLETAASLLNEISQVEENTPEVISSGVNPGADTSPDPYRAELAKPRWAIFLWLVPLLLGIALTGSVAIKMYQKLNNAGMVISFWFLTIPFAVGIFLIYTGWALQTAKWIFLEFQRSVGKKPEHILLAFPLPFRLARYFLGMFEEKLPARIRRMDLQSVFDTLESQINRDQPLFVNGNEDSGTGIKIYFA